VRGENKKMVHPQQSSGAGAVVRVKVVHSQQNSGVGAAVSEYR
jgi:hypothetical protein